MDYKYKGQYILAFPYFKNDFISYKYYSVAINYFEKMVCGIHPDFEQPLLQPTTQPMNFV